MGSSPLGRHPVMEPLEPFTMYLAPENTGEHGMARLRGWRAFLLGDLRLGSMQRQLQPRRHVVVRNIRYKKR